MEGTLNHYINDEVVNIDLYWNLCIWINVALW